MYDDVACQITVIAAAIPTVRKTVHRTNTSKICLGAHAAVFLSYSQSDPNIKDAAPLALCKHKYGIHIKFGYLVCKVRYELR